MINLDGREGSEWRVSADMLSFVGRRIARGDAHPYNHIMYAQCDRACASHVASTAYGTRETPTSLSCRTHMCMHRCVVLMMVIVVIVKPVAVTMV